MAKKKKPLTIEDIFDDDEETLEDKLYAVRKEIASLTELSKRYANQLMEDMLTKGQRRTSRFKIAIRKTLLVVEPDTAFKWAAERNCIDINTTKAMQLIRRELEIPDGFTVQQTEYLTSAGRQHETDFDDSDVDS